MASFVGLTCSEYSTGETERKERITGMGSGFIRAMLVELLDRGPQGPVLLAKLAGYGIERQQEKSDRRSSADPYRPLQGLRDHGHAVCGRDNQMKKI